MFNSQSKLSSQYLDKFLDLNSKSKKKVLSSHKIRLKKDGALKKMETLKLSRFHNKLFAFNKKVLDFKILQFFSIMGAQAQSNNISKINRDNFVKSGSSQYILKSIYFFVKSAFTLLSILNTNFSFNGNNFFSDKGSLLSFIYFFKHKLFTSFIYSNNTYNKFKFFSFKFFLNYFIFNLYINLKNYVRINLEKHGGSNLLNKNVSGYISSILTSENNKAAALNYYEEYVYKSTTLSVISKKVGLETNNSKSLLSHRICRKQLYKTKKVLDDKKFSVVLNLVRNYLKSKSISNPNALKAINQAIQNTTPLYKIAYQKRGRNKVAIAKYLFINKIRESMAIKWVMGSIPSVRLKKTLKHHRLEYKIAAGLLDSFFCRGSAFAKSKDSRTTPNKGASILNKGYLLKTTKPLLSK